MAEKIVKDSQGLAKDLVNDCISRQAAIDEVINLWADKPFGPPALVEIKDCIEKLPSAQPERKRGKWEIYVISLFDGVGCRCSECGFEGVTYWDFCPNCGADMRGEQDE